MIPYIHRDISWLSFNYRVLQEAKDPNVPLFERIKFLAIYSSNLEEYFKVRVANHRNLARIVNKTKKVLDYDPQEILNKIRDIVAKQQDEFTRIFEEEIIPDLKKLGIRILKRNQLNEEQINYIEDYFNGHLLPFVQPVLLLGKKVKPFLNNGELYLGIFMKEKDKDKHRYGIVKIPSEQVSRFIILPPKKNHKHDIIFLDDVVRHQIQFLFPGFEIIDSFSLKTTRDAELYIDDEFSGDLVHKIKKSLAKRKVGITSRMVYDRQTPKHLLNELMEVYGIKAIDLIPEGRYHNNKDFFGFPNFSLTQHKDQKLPPIHINSLEKAESIFDKIRKRDYLIHVPYHSYNSVIKFFEDAAEDPKVTHIKIIQYRVARKSRIMNALIKAVKRGKQVSAFIEVKARFDEEANLRWGEKLEAAGIKVIYSMPGLKVHSKMALVRRIEKETEKIYSYFSTGNFHEDTAKLYSDVGIFTADERLTLEGVQLFKYLETKKVPTKPFKHLLVGQFGFKSKLINLIHNEVANAKKGLPANIFLKMNSLQDKEMIQELYSASQKGVKIVLDIRGICCLVPGIKGISNNIHAFSILDKYLEHSRIFIFHNNGEDNTYISSADWMGRNLHRRVETIVPIYDSKVKNTIIELMTIQLNDNVKSRLLHYKKENEYYDNEESIDVRTQIDSYHYIKRITK